MHDYHDYYYSGSDDANSEDFDDPVEANLSPTVNVPVLLEVRIGECWAPVRIAREFPNFRAALNTLPVFAKQQKTVLECVRVKALRTESALFLAENDIIEHHRRHLDDPRR